MLMPVASTPVVIADIANCRVADYVGDRGQYAAGCEWASSGIRGFVQQAVVSCAKQQIQQSYTGFAVCTLLPAAGSVAMLPSADS